MAPITRRRFVAYTGGFIALRAHPLKALADQGQGPEAPAPPSAHLDAAAIQRLATQTVGHVITPDAPEYESARLVFNRAFDKRTGFEPVLQP